MDARTLVATRWGRLVWTREPVEPGPPPEPPAPPEAPNVDEVLAELGFDPAPAEPEGPPPLVSILGPVEIGGHPVDGTHPWKYTKAGELVVFLALQGRPMDRDAVMEALWPGEPPDRDRLARVVSDARRNALGADGEWWLPSDRATLQVRCEVDWPRAETELLGWVRGPVFDTGGLEWAWAQAQQAEVRAEVAAVGLRVASAALLRGDAGHAVWAARKGLEGDPYSVELVQLVAEAGLAGEDAGAAAWAHERLGELL